MFSDRESKILEKTRGIRNNAVDIFLEYNLPLRI